MALAVDSAIPAASNGISQRNGLRYTMIKMIATTRAVAPSKVVSIAPKTLIRSERIPTGPVALI